MKRNLNDTRAQYQLMMDEVGILLAAEDILRRRLERQGTIGSPTECIDYLRARCAHLANEVFGVLWLDTRHRVIDAEHLFTGTIDGCEIHPPHRRQTCPGNQRGRRGSVPHPPLGQPGAQ